MKMFIIGGYYYTVQKTTERTLRSKQVLKKAMEENKITSDEALMEAVRKTIKATIRKKKELNQFIVISNSGRITKRLVIERDLI